LLEPLVQRRVHRRYEEQDPQRILGEALQRELHRWVAPVDQRLLVVADHRQAARAVADAQAREVHVAEELAVAGLQAPQLLDGRAQEQRLGRLRRGRSGRRRRLLYGGRLRGRRRLLRRRRQLGQGGPGLRQRRGRVVRHQGAATEEAAERLLAVVVPLQ